MKIAVIGDCLTDRYWIGASTRTSAEVPIPVVKIEERFDLAGGARNVAMNLVGMGEKAVMPWGSELNSPIKNRLVLVGTQIARWDENDTCYAQDVNEAFLCDCDAVVVADYLKGSISPEVRDTLLGARLPTFVDTKGDPGSWLDIATVVFPNEKEYEKYQDVYDQFELVVRKRGPRGCSLMSRGRFWCNYPAEARKVVSVNGAGDTVVAAFVSEWGRLGWQESMANRALRFANTAGAIACEGKYTSVVSREQVEARRKGIV